MWANTAPSAEDIFVLNYTGGDATSMHNMWTAQPVAPGYGAAMYRKGFSLIADTDFRRGMLNAIKTGTPTPGTSMITRKYPNVNFVNNIPIFRASEMWLIIAEARARQGSDMTPAKEALFHVAQRNRAIADAASIPAANQTELLAFIADERVRELTQEGHRWFDLRRRGDIMNRVANETPRPVSNFDVRRSVMPIPVTEINVPKTNVVQNDWSYRPSS
jgi:hypothetical protein